MTLLDGARCDQCSVTREFTVRNPEWNLCDGHPHRWAVSVRHLEEAVVAANQTGMLDDDTTSELLQWFGYDTQQ